MKNVAIIGAGQLGSRHLQALALHEDELMIYVVDPSQESLEQSKKRFEEVDTFQNKNLYFEKHISTLPAFLDFVVIATNSIERLSVLKQLVKQSKVHYLLLEKFLFPKTTDYTEALELIKTQGIKVFVNCARRMWPNYQEIKKKISGDSNMKLIVNGGSWNMASNAIHFLDLLFYLTNDNNISFDITKLDQKLLNNKRKGYIEISGTLYGKTENGNELMLMCKASDDIHVELTIETEKWNFKINEMGQTIQSSKNGQEIIDEFKVCHQSSLTHKVFEQLIKSGTCDLVKFEESINHHLLLLNKFNEFLGEREGAIT